MPAKTTKSVGRKLDIKTIEFKYQALLLVEKGEKSKSEIARKLKIKCNTLSTWIKHADSIKSGYQNYGPQRKAMKTGKWAELEKVLVKWINYARDAGAQITGPMLIKKATEFAVKLNMDDFTADKGWLERFKNRHGIRFKGTGAETKAEQDDKAAVSAWHKKMSSLLEKYSSDDIYNGKETVIFYEMLPDTPCDCDTDQQCKDRLTVLVCANMTGNHKLPLLVVGRTTESAGLRDEKTLPTEFTTSQNALVTTQIFKDWVEKLEFVMKTKNKKIALIVDSCAAHPRMNKLKFVNLIFLPRNVASKLQPMELGILKNFKVEFNIKYKKKIVLRQIQAKEKRKDFSITLLEALHLLHSAWDSVTPTAIANCFRRAGIQKDVVGIKIETDEDDGQGIIPMTGIKEEDDSQASLNFISFNEDLQTTEAITDDDIMSDVLQFCLPDIKEEREDHSDNSESFPQDQGPDVNQAIEHLAFLQRYFHARGNSERELSMLGMLSETLTCDKFRQVK